MWKVPRLDDRGVRIFWKKFMVDLLNLKYSMPDGKLTGGFGLGSRGRKNAEHLLYPGRFRLMQWGVAHP
jgi:hypothetical protein